MSINCKNCNSSNESDYKFCCNCGAKIEGNNIDENEEVLRYCKGGKGFKKGELYAYSDRIEFRGKKVIEKIFYSNLEKVKITLGTLELKITDNEYKAFDVEDDIDEWIKLIKNRMLYYRNNNINKEIYEEDTIEKEEIKHSYYKIKKFLKKKDNKVHIVMINSKNKTSCEDLVCENKYTTEVDNILSFMQDDGYEIVDVKYEVFIRENYGLNYFDIYRTLIMYK
ncbi:MAG: zinc ribbon domain-containing protein [Terrisporobacter sp.]